MPEHLETPSFDNPATHQTAQQSEDPASWLPMLVIASAQIQMAFNVSALIMSMGAIVDAFDTSPTVVGSSLVVYSLCVAAFVMLGAKIAVLFGARRVFLAGVLVHGLAMGIMAASVNPVMMLISQAIAGVAAAALVPVLVVMIAVHYRSGQQEKALGLLGSSQASAAVMAFLAVGLLNALTDWRWSFGILVLLGILNGFLTFRLESVDAEPEVKIDWIGALLIAVAVVLVSLGLDGISSWGFLVARDDAPFSILGLSPAPVLITLGIVFGQGFFLWLRRRRSAHESQLFALEVLDTREEKAATFSLFLIGTLGPAVNFLIPLYIQIVQDRSSLQTAVALIPYSLSILTSAALVVRLYRRLAPRQIGRFGFVTVAIGLTFLAFAIHNDWGTPLVIAALTVVGLGEGALLTLFFNVLVSASPKELAGHVGALRGTVNNLTNGLGTALASTLAVVVLGALIASSVFDNPNIPPSLIDQVNLDNVNFLTNEQLEEVLAETTATPEQVDEAIQINEDTRLRALKISFLFLATIALAGILPASGLPPYQPGEIPEEHLAGLAVSSEEEMLADLCQSTDHATAASCTQRLANGGSGYDG